MPAYALPSGLPLSSLGAALVCALMASCGGGGSEPANATVAAATATPLGTTSTLPDASAVPAASVPAAPGFYVDAKLGDDNSPGSVDRPWRTLARAGAVTLQTGQGLFLRCGQVWRERLVLGPNQLTDGSILAGYGDDCAKKPAVISGADDFSTGWSLSNGVWSRSLPAATPKITQLFANGQPLRTARWPDDSASGTGMKMAPLATSTNSAATKNASLNLRNADASPLPAGDVVGATIQIQTQAWAIETRQVSAVSGATVTLDYATYWDLAAGQGYVLQDKLWMMNTPGEFFHDLAAQRLYLIAPTAGVPADLNNAAIEGSVRDNALTIGERSGLTVRNVATLAARAVGALVIDAPAAQLLQIESSSNGGVGLQFRNSTPSSVNRPTATVADSVFSSNAQIGIDASDVNNVAILRNVVTDTGNGAHHGANVLAAIWSGPAGRVEGNTVRGSGYLGIRFSSFQGSTVTRNLVTGHCSRLADCAGIYTWVGPNLQQGGHTSTVEGNKIGAAEPVASGLTTGGSDIAAGIYIDDFADGVTVADNLLLNPSTGVFVHNASRVTVKNNRIWLATSAALWASMDRTDIDAMTGNLFQGNQVVPILQASAAAAGLPRFSSTHAIRFWHAMAGAAALAPNRNTFKDNAYIQLQGALDSHAWVAGSGAPGMVNALQWQQLTAGDMLPTRPANFRPLALTLGAEQVIDTGFDGGLAHWQTWNAPSAITFSARADATRPGCVGMCISLTSGTKGDLLASRPFQLKPAVPYVYRWAAVLPSTSGGGLGPPYISRDSTPWDTMADAQDFISITTREGVAGERLDYEAFFMPKSADPARVNLQLSALGVSVGIDSASVREVLGYTAARRGDWISIASAPASASATFGCAELQWPAGCKAIGLDGQPVALPLVLPAGSDTILMRADSVFRR